MSEVYIAPGFQTVRYCGVSLLDSENTFELRWGCRPSFGKFRCTQEDYATIIATSEDGSEVSGNLEFFDGSTRSVTLKDIRLIKATLNPTNFCYDLVLADRRIDWTRETGAKDYNIYSASRDADGDDYMVDSGTKNSGNLWTFQQVLTDLLASDAPTVNATDRCPANVRGKGRTYSEILEDLMYQGNYVMLLDAVNDAFICVDLGHISSGDTTALEDYLDFTHITHDVEPGFGWYPTYIRGWYGKSDGSMGSVSTNVDGGLEGVKSFPLPWADSTDGIAACQEWCDENAANWNDAVLWKDTWLVGLHDVTPSTEVHTIRWIAGKNGSYTVIRRFFPQTIPTPAPSHLFAYDGYSLNSGGSGGAVIQVIATHTTAGMYTVGESVGAVSATAYGINLNERKADGTYTGHAIDPTKAPNAAIAVDSHTTESGEVVYYFQLSQGGC